MLETAEDKAALGLLVAGVALLGWSGNAQAGPIGAAIVLLILGIYALISVIAGVAAAFMTASFINASFGLFGPAVLRLAGLIVFTIAIDQVLPMGWFFSIVSYVILLLWFFELEIFEIVVFTVVLWIVRFAAIIGLVAMMNAARA